MELPPDLPSAHKEVLEQFRAGHLTAGQLTERLQRLRTAPGPNAPTAAMAAVAPRHARRRRLRRAASMLALVTLGTVGGIAAGIEIGSRAQPVAAQTPPHAHVTTVSR